MGCDEMGWVRYKVTKERCIEFNIALNLTNRLHFTVRICTVIDHR